VGSVGGTVGTEEGFVGTEGVVLGSVGAVGPSCPVKTGMSTAASRITAKTLQRMISVRLLMREISFLFQSRAYRLEKAVSVSKKPVIANQ